MSIAQKVHKIGSFTNLHHYIKRRLFNWHLSVCFAQTIKNLCDNPKKLNRPKACVYVRVCLNMCVCLCVRMCVFVG
jgi:hypothetical protein